MYLFHHPGGDALLPIAGLLFSLPFFGCLAFSSLVIAFIAFILSTKKNDAADILGKWALVVFFLLGSCVVGGFLLPFLMLPAMFL